MENYTYVWSQDSDDEMSREVLLHLRKQHFNLTYRLHAGQIFVANPMLYTERNAARAFCLGYAVAKGWRKS